MSTLLLLLLASALQPYARSLNVTWVTWRHLARCCCPCTAGPCCTAGLPLVWACPLAGVWQQVAALGGWQGAFLHRHTTGSGQCCALHVTCCILLLLLLLLL
jgi:hypothetical protein